MDYPHDRQRSLTCLRTAVALMGKHAAVLDPVSYAVWYDYAAGGSTELKRSLDELVARGGLLGQEAARELFVRHLARPDAGPSMTVLNQVLGLTQAVSESTAQARQVNDELGRSLSHFESRLGQPPGAESLGAAVDDMRQASEQTTLSIQQVAAQLARHGSEIDRLRSELEQARQDASLDGLTKVLNRRAFDAALAHCLNASAHGPAADAPCLLLLDVDNFKQLNDGFGHAFGDEVLRALAQVLRSVIVPGDSVGRFGGDEFALLLLGRGPDEARSLAERLRELVANARVRSGHGPGQRGQVTISLGAAAWVHGDDAVSWLQRADAALYQAKHQGRNSVVWAGA